MDSYTFYYDDGIGVCHNVTLDSTTTSYTIANGQEIQIAAHQNDVTKCSPGMYSCNNPSNLYVISDSLQVQVYVQDSSTYRPISQGWAPKLLPLFYYCSKYKWAQDHAPERKESFYAKIKVSAFVNFEIDCLKKMMMKKSAV